ncbi:MAG: rhodanese-like domain-containing protein [Desulfobacula sp.]|uniref:rhodanese-like domain-containing protein n=1 Tax=Desulfobacula sp. TaxID=2593537 RepID=UPI0025C0B692|nr:rhodanese-like domain-containing protein [Desulfobacula sp.]MCD4722660.1 rhodanese-like domain-containing protein [Desulfobacula sp.]
MTPKDIKGIFLLFVFALTTAFFYNWFSPFGIALLGQWETSKGVVTAISKTDSVTASIEINNPMIIKQIVQKKEKIILDVRPREIYDQGHLPYALSFPLMDFDDSVGQLLSSINRQSAILVYCSSFECTDSHMVAQRLKNLRFIDVKVFSGGFRQWQEMGYEIEKNEK